jgi:phage repressor protein C with HTH and peptisase S24 domain
MNVGKRLKEFLNYLKISQGKFEAKANLSNGYVNNLKDNIRRNTLRKISDAYPELNITWLLTGEGEMLKNKTNITEEQLLDKKALHLKEKAERKISVKPLDDIRYMNVPFVPVHAQAGYMAEYGDQEYIDELPTIPIIVDKNYKGKYRVFEVEGDSMDDGSRNALYDGDKILCRDVKQELWTNKLHIRDWYFVIVSKTDGVIVKQIIEHDVDTGNIICHSLNPIFGDRKINLNDVSELYSVIKIVDRSARI